MKELAGCPPSHEEELVMCRVAADFILQSCFPPALFQRLAASLVMRAVPYQPKLASAWYILVLGANQSCLTYMQQTAVTAPGMLQS